MRGTTTLMEHPHVKPHVPWMFLRLRLLNGTARARTRVYDMRKTFQSSGKVFFLSKWALSTFG